MRRSQIAKIIDDLVWFWRETTRMSAARINKGSCVDFANDLAKEIPGAVVCFNYQYPHAYVSYKGRHYDSETPYGVRRVTDLPCIRRMIKEERLTNDRAHGTSNQTQVGNSNVHPRQESRCRG